MNAAGADLVESFHARRLWWSLAWQEIRGRYRRTVLGPFWITIGLATLVAMLGYIYPSLFGQTADDYTPYLTAGFIAWYFISSFMTEGCFSILNATNSIKQIKVPITLFCFQTVARNCIVFAHNFLVFVAVALIFGLPLKPVTLLVIPATMIYVGTGLGAGVVLAILCARYRDIPQFVATVMQMLFFLTPVFWRADNLPERAQFILFNPFYHYVEIFRAPLLGTAPAMASWLVTLGCMVFFFIAMLVVLTKYRHRVIFWI